MTGPTTLDRIFDVVSFGLGLGALIVVVHAARGMAARKGRRRTVWGICTVLLMPSYLILCLLPAREARPLPRGERIVELAALGVTVLMIVLALVSYGGDEGQAQVACNSPTVLAEARHQLGARVRNLERISEVPVAPRRKLCLADAIAADGAAVKVSFTLNLRLAGWKVADTTVAHDPPAGEP